VKITDNFGFRVAIVTSIKTFTHFLGMNALTLNAGQTGTRSRRRVIWTSVSTIIIAPDMHLPCKDSMFALYFTYSLYSHVMESAKG
jgi:hypothetical protein